MTKVVIQMSHLRIDDKTTYQRGDVVNMNNNQIERLDNAVKLLSEVNHVGDGMDEAMQKKDAEIRALKAKVDELDLEIVSLNDKLTPSVDKRSKTESKTA